MNQYLTVTVIQSELYWENTTMNLNNFAETLSAIQSNTDLIILPEMFTTGFSMNPEVLAETMAGQTINWLKQQTQKYQAAIVGSLIVKEKNQYYNRLIFMLPDGHYHFYDKKYLFSLAGEDKIYQRGNEKLIVNYKGWKICPLICYDLRFPEWSRNYENYDLLIYVANWPEKRSEHWKKLLAARAIENQSYTIGVNRIGKDGNNLMYSGDTTIVNMLGNVLYTKAYKKDVFTMTLDKTFQIDKRKQLPFLGDIFV